MASISKYNKTKTDKQTDTPVLNIRFVGRNTEINGKTLASEPLTLISDDMMTYVLPEANEQREGFYHAQAVKIVRLYPELYKLLVSKGE